VTRRKLDLGKRGVRGVVMRVIGHRGHGGVALGWGGHDGRVKGLLNWGHESVRVPVTCLRTRENESRLSSVKNEGPGGPLGQLSVHGTGGGGQEEGRGRGLIRPLECPVALYGLSLRAALLHQQLAETISDESMYETDNMYNNAIAATEVDLDTIDIVGNNPFDDWQREALSDLNDLVLDNEVQTEVLSVAAPRNIESEVESQARTVEDKKEEEILHDPDLFPTDQTQSGSALLEDFDEDLLESKLIRSDLDKIVKQDVVLPQMSSLQNSSAPYRSVAPASLLDHPSYSEQTDNLTQTAASSKESSVDRDLMEEINVEVDQDDEDIIMQVLRESNINFDEIPIDIEGLKVEEEIKLEDIKEEVVEVEDIGYQISIVDGAAAKAEIDYDQLHSDIKAKFQEADDGYSFAELTLGSQFSDAYNPGFNSRAFENDHSYGVTTKLEPSGLLEPTTSRRRNVSESSGYSSMTEDLSSSRCRDEIKAKKLKLPFLVHDIINSPVDLFNEMLLRPGLSSEQLQLCKDIRRRGKNKVAAQNCRKRKMDTIEELQHQVDQVRRRREQLLRAREELEAERARWSSKLSYLEENVLHGIGKELGMFTLEVRDNTVVVTSTANLLTAGGAEKSPSRSQN